MALYTIFEITESGTSYVVRYDSASDTVRVYDSVGNEQVDTPPISNPYTEPAYAGGRWFNPINTYPYAEPVPAAGQPLGTQCYGYDLYNIYTDGMGGIAQGELVEANSTSCGYAPPIDCVASFSFTLDPIRGERYFVQFPDRSGRTHRVGYWENGYEGTPEELRGAGSPAILDYPGTNDKMGLLSGSGLALNIIVQRYGLLEELYTTDERKYRVDHTINGSLAWRGYHIPDIYNEPLKALPFEANLQAHDGLAALDNMPYLNNAGERWYGRVRSVDVIARCLRKLDLDLPVWLAVNVWEDTMDLNVEPLAQSYADQSGYYDENNEPQSCGEVLKDLLDPYKAYIIQQGGALHIIRRNEVQGAYKRRLMHLGKGDSTLQINVEEQTFADTHTIISEHGQTGYRENVQALSTMPAIKYVATVTEYGNYENFLYNGDFERWANGLPLFWSGNALIEPFREERKFALKFLEPFQSVLFNGMGRVSGNRTNVPTYIENREYEYPVSSEVGFTVGFDYRVIIDEYGDWQGGEWLEYPAFLIEENKVYILNPTRAMFGASEVVFEMPAAEIANVSGPGVDSKRIDILYANSNGTYSYVQGTANPKGQMDLVPVQPEGTLIVTYVSWYGDSTPVFSSCSEECAAQFLGLMRIGNKIYAPPFEGRRVIGSSGDSRRTTQAETAPYILKAGWVDYPLDNNTMRYRTTFQTDSLGGTGGYKNVSGSFELDLPPLLEAGLPTMRILTPIINRDSLRGVSVIIDNVRFQEKDTGTEKMIIAGENPGKINTAPLEVTLRHGSGIPRTEALLTLADGTPTLFWNGGMLLQEITARDILAQHTRQTYVLNATIRGNMVTPLTTLIDPFYPNRRFYPDRFTYRLREGLIDVSALEVFGGAYDATPPNAMLHEDGTPMKYENFGFMLYE